MAMFVSNRLAVVAASLLCLMAGRLATSVSAARAAPSEVCVAIRR